MGQRVSVWVTDAGGGFVGWIDRTGLQHAANTADAVMRATDDSVTITDAATLREALSRMLGQGMRSTPVVDRNGNFIGEVNLGDIEAVTAEGEG